MATRNWNSTLEGVPADADALSEGAQRMRERWKDIRERAAIEHQWGNLATEEASGVPGRHMQGSAIAFTMAGVGPPTQLADVADTQPLTADGAGAALGTKDQGRLWVTDGLQLQTWDGMAWLPINNLDPALMIDSDAISTDQTITDGSWQIIEKSTGVNLECSVTIPAGGLWRIEVRYNIGFFHTGANNDELGSVAMRLRLEDTGATVTNVGLGWWQIDPNSTSAIREQLAISGVRSWNAPLVTEVYTVNLEAFTTSETSTIDSVGQRESTDVSWMEVLVLPYGA